MMFGGADHEIDNCILNSAPKIPLFGGILVPKLQSSKI